MIIIRKGHYQEKSSINSERPTIIRVLGPDNAKEGYSIIQDGKSLPDYLIDSEYILLDTSSTEKPITKIPPKNIFDGLLDIEESESQLVQTQTTQLIQPSIIPVNSTHLEPVIINTQPPQIPFDISVIEKINIDNLNLKSMENLGILKYQKPNIDIQINIPFDYDIAKLKHTINLLELDENIIIDYLVQKIQYDLIQSKLKERIKELLFGNETEILIDEPEITQSLKSVGLDVVSVVPVVQIPSEKEIELEKGISEVSDYLKTLIG